MDIVALIMAGGKGSRMGGTTEKPLIKLQGRSIIGRVIEAVKETEGISGIYVAVTNRTPKTMREVLKYPVKIIKTDGLGYHADLQQAILKANLKCTVLTLSSDLPLLTGEFLSEVLSYYKKTGKPALAVLAPLRVCNEYGVEPSSSYKREGKCFAVSGVNIVDGQKILEGEQDQDFMVSERIEAVFNVNTLKDLDLAQKILEKKGVQH